MILWLKCCRCFVIRSSFVNTDDDHENMTTYARARVVFFFMANPQLKYIKYTVERVRSIIFTNFNYLNRVNVLFSIIIVVFVVISGRHATNDDTDCAL